MKKKIFIIGIAVVLTVVMCSILMACNPPETVRGTYVNGDSIIEVTKEGAIFTHVLVEKTTGRPDLDKYVSCDNVRVEEGKTSNSKIEFYFIYPDENGNEITLSAVGYKNGDKRQCIKLLDVEYVR